METVRRVAPYLLIEILLPGGTLVAAVLWLIRRRSRLARPCRNGPRPFDQAL
jgi:hypothetical protein